MRFHPGQGPGRTRTPRVLVLNASFLAGTAAVDSISGGHWSQLNSPIATKPPFCEIVLQHEAVIDTDTPRAARQST